MACDAIRTGRRAKLGDRSPREEDRFTAVRSTVDAHDGEEDVIIVGMVIKAGDPGLVGRHDVRERCDRSEREDDEDTEREPQRRSASVLRAMRRGPLSNRC